MGSGPEAPSELFRDWQRTQTQSSATADDRLKAANGCPVLREAGTTAARHQASCESCFPFVALSSVARVRRRVFSLDNLNGRLGHSRDENGRCFTSRMTPRTSEGR